MRDDEQIAAVAGKSVLQLKLQAFGIAAALSGLAGALYAHFTSFIAPDVFIVQLTIYIFLAVTIGGYTASPAPSSDPLPLWRCWRRPAFLPP